MRISIAAVAGAVALIGTITGGVFVVEDRYQKIAVADKQRAEMNAQVELVGKRLDGKIEVDRWYRNAEAIRSYKVFDNKDCNRYRGKTKHACLGLFRQRKDIEKRLRDMNIPIPRVQ